MSLATTTYTPRERRPRLLVGVGSVAGTVVAGAVTGVLSPIAAAVGVLFCLGLVGWYLWRSAPNRREAQSQLGTGLLASIVVAAAIGGAQLAIEDHRRDLESDRQREAQRAAERQDLRITVGLQPSLVGIDLSDLDLTSFYFARKDLANARFDKAVLDMANFERANLKEAKLQGAKLRGANLFEANLRASDLTGAKLNGASAMGARLNNAELPRADLRATELLAACLHVATLRSANLRGADLRGADFRRADLRGADLRGAKLRPADLRGVIADSRTRWPAGLDRDSPEVASDLPACKPRAARP